MPQVIFSIEKIAQSLSALTELDLSHCAITLQDLTRLADLLTNYPKMISLNLTGNHLGDACVPAILAMQHLTKVNLLGNKITDKGAKLLGESKTLHYLNLNFNWLTDEGAIALGQCASLKWLSLNGNSEGNGFSFQGLIGFAENCQLVTLSLMNNSINSQGANVLSTNKCLQRLFLDNNHLSDAGALVLAEHPSLIELSLGDNNISAKGALTLAEKFRGRILNLTDNKVGSGASALFKNASTEVLILSNNHINTLELTNFSENSLLRHVDLSYNQITDTVLNDLAKNTHLTYLNVSRNNIHAEGVESLAKYSRVKMLNLSFNRLDNQSAVFLSKNGAIEELNVTGNFIGPEGASALSEMPGLKRLYINYNLISDAGGIALSKSTSIEEFYLSYNQIGDLGAELFLKRANIKRLDLNFNQISSALRTVLLAHFPSDVLSCSLEQPPDFTKENLSNIFLFSKGYFCIISTSGIIQFFNCYFSSSLGYESGDLLAKPLIDFLHPDDSHRVSDLLKQVMMEEIEVRFFTKRGDFRIINLCFHRQATRIYLTGTDLSPQKKTERMLHQLLTDEISQSKQFAAKQTEFIAHLCHEIRNPVSGVLSLSDVIFEHVQTLNSTLDALEKEGKEVPEQKVLHEVADSIDKALGDIKVCCRYEESVLNDNLDMAKITSRKVQLHNLPVDLRQELEEVILMNQVKAHEVGLALTLDTSGVKDCGAKVDALRFKQIMVNLVNNALKFTEKGSVAVTLTLLEQSSTENFFTIVVADTGIGLTEEEINKLFDCYAQANISIGSQYGGTGLGLYIAKQLAKLMGGDLMVKSKPGIGSEFTCTIRVERLSAEEKLALIPKVKANSPVIAALALTKRTVYRILIVEDNEINCKSLIFLFNKIGHRTVCVHDGVAAVDYYKNCHQSLDAILMDTYMPKMNGLEATKVIRRFEQEQCLARKPIITLSGNAQESDKTLAFDVGSDAYLTKPFKKDMLIEVLDRLVVSFVTPSPPTSPVTTGRELASVFGPVLTSVPLPVPAPVPPASMPTAGLVQVPATEPVPTTRHRSASYS